jgi:hypothetical protein
MICAKDDESIRGISGAQRNGVDFRRREVAIEDLEKAKFLRSW